MVRDASLDEFLNDDDREAGEATAEPAAEPAAESAAEPASEGESVSGRGSAPEDESGDATDGAASDEAADVAVASYDWSPGGSSCASCGETVERRWRDDAGFVCEDCKDW